MKNPLVSIGLPTHNGERFLRQALDSILNQSFEDFELVISDNASTDATPSICREYASEDVRIRYVRNENNIGQTANINQTIEISRGVYYRMHHDDDLLHPRCIEHCVNVLEHAPTVALCHTQTRVIDEAGEVLLSADPMDYHLRSKRPSSRFEKYMRQRFPSPPHPGLMNAIFGLIRRDVLMRTPLDSTYMHADVIHCGGLTLYGEFHLVDEPLFFRRDHPGRSMRAYQDKKAHALWRDPTSEGITMPRLYGLLDLVWIVWRAPISWSEKQRCFRIIQRHYLRHFYRSAARELLQGAVDFVRYKLTGRPVMTPGT